MSKTHGYISNMPIYYIIHMHMYQIYLPFYGHIFTQELCVCAPNFYQGRYPRFHKFSRTEHTVRFRPQANQRKKRKMRCGSPAPSTPVLNKNSVQVGANLTYPRCRERVYPCLNFYTFCAKIMGWQTLPEFRLWQCNFKKICSKRPRT